MIAITNARGARGLGYISSRSRTFAVPGAMQTVTQLQARAGRQRVQISRTGMGNGMFATVPAWTWWAGGGLLAGLVGGALIFKKKRK